MDVKTGLGEANHEDCYDEQGEDNGESDVLEADFAFVLGDFSLDLEESESEDREDEAELGENDASGAEGVDDEPRMGHPGDFGEEEADDESDESRFRFVGLDEDVVGSGETNEKTSENKNGRIGEGAEDAGGSSAEKNGDESLDDIGGAAGAGLNEN